MTVLAALNYPGKGTVIGCDRRASTSFHYTDNVIKWVVGDKWAVGQSGALRVLNLIDLYKDDLLSVVSSPVEFTINLATMLSESGVKAVADADDNVGNFQQSLLLANSEGVWSIDGSMAVVQHKPGELVASGSGWAYALGAGHMTRSAKDPVVRVRSAIEAAVAFDPCCGGEPWLCHLKPAKPSNQVL